MGVSLSYIIFDHSFELKANVAVMQISGISPSLGIFVSEMVRLIGLNWLTWGFLAAVISVTAFRKGEMWAWYALWIVPAYFIADGAIDFLAGGTSWLNGVIVAILVMVPLLTSPQFDAILLVERLVRMGALKPVSREDVNSASVNKQV